MNNKNSIYSTLLTSSAEEASILDRWLEEREVSLDTTPLASREDDASVEDGDRLNRARGDYDGDIKPGQLRILSCRFTRTPEEIPFVVVLERWEKRGGSDDMWLIAPFSSYSTPATPGEMSSGLHLLGREVIQAWNARTVQSCLLRKSYLCDTVDEHVVSDARALFRNQFAGTALPQDFSELRGPEIVFEADPRRDYLDESIRRFAPLSEDVRRMENARIEPPDEDGDAQQEEAKRWEPRLAAGDKEGADVRRLECAVKDRPELVRIIFSAESGKLSLRIFDKDGNDAESLDGWILVGGGGVVLGEIENGGLTVDGVPSIPAVFCLADGYGAVLPIIPPGR